MKKLEEYKDILTFWFKEAGSEKWFAKDDDFDEEIRRRFLLRHKQARRGELWKWRESIHGRLAEIILLDQFSRNMFREDPRAFQYDELALVLAQEAIINEYFHLLTVKEKAFVYMPFMHSESLTIQEQSLKLFKEKGLETNYQYAQEHYEIIKKFGRFPHRNQSLNRESTTKETMFLKTHSGF